ncbi:hypothetical protein [Phocaeicola sp.]|uniref:hypothetical protein n=1 Tax=Phocaeicola sp. TaxID=2773926 RepID=UPI0023CB7382|nr:hypothetical protein [Phocaeicola sp.]MDE5676732.1 hypothetical protein [Phocaeicola sp.]
MKGPGRVSSHPRNPHRQGVLADNERMKGKVESHQCCILCEGETIQKMMASDNAGPKDDGNFSCFLFFDNLQAKIGCKEGFRFA